MSDDIPDWDDRNKVCPLIGRECIRGRCISYSEYERESDALNPAYEFSECVMMDDLKLSRKTVHKQESS